MAHVLFFLITCLCKEAVNITHVFDFLFSYVEFDDTTTHFNAIHLMEIKFRGSSLKKHTINALQ